MFISIKRPSQDLSLLALTALMLLTAWAFAAPDYKPIAGKSVDAAGPLGNLDASSRRFAVLQKADPEGRRVTLLLEGETESQEWPVLPDAEVWYSGWWGRLDQFTPGDRVWVWFKLDKTKKPEAVSLLADELSEHDLYKPVRVKAVNVSGPEPRTVTLETSRAGKPAERTVSLAKAELYRGNAAAAHESLKVGEKLHVQTAGDNARLILDPPAFEKRRAAQKELLRKRWADEGLPGTLLFSHPEQREVELMLNHEAMHWGRSLQAGDKVMLQGEKPIPAVVKGLRPWRERTQVLLEVATADSSQLTVGERVSLGMGAPPAADDDALPPGVGKSTSKPERVEWLMSSIYCTCGMHDQCAGHFYTLAACNSGATDPCGLAKNTREDIAERIDKGDSDRQIFEDLLKERGPKLLRPHMSP